MEIIPGTGEICFLSTYLHNLATVVTYLLTDCYSTSILRVKRITSILIYYSSAAGNTLSACNFEIDTVCSTSWYPAFIF